MTSNIKAAKWFVRLNPDPLAKLRLFCFPYAGGGISSFRGWLNLLPRGVELDIVELPGRGSRLLETPYFQVQLLIDEITQAIQPLLDRPFAFFGHSLGAVLGFETAREIMKLKGINPVILFVSGRNAPQLTDLSPSIQHLSDADFVDRLRQYNGTPKEVLENAELMEIFLPVLRADFTMNETYVYKPGPPLDCPITAFGGKTDPRVSVDELHAWDRMTLQEFSMVFFPGDHFYLHSEQAILLKTISTKLSPLLSK